MKLQKIIFGLIAYLLAILVSNVYAIEANNTFELSLISNDWKTAIVELHVINPSNQEIASVQSWLEFDINKLKWKSIETESSPFDFVIPWESNFVWNLVKLWRSSLWWDTSWEKIFVAKITFDIVSNGWEIKFYDYQPWEWWHVSIQVFDNWFPINTLKWEPESLIILNNEVEQVQEPISIENNLINQEPVSEYVLERPANIMITSTPWEAVIKWDKVQNANNYYLYYSKTSWRYLNRRMVWDTDMYILQWLETGTQYFFAITAVWQDSKESDYSNEAAIIVWNPNTSTSPLIKTEKKVIKDNLINQIKNVISKDKNTESNIWTKWINKNSETGPKEILMISAILASILSIYFNRKRKFL